jgi:hypothetical protein
MSATSSKPYWRQTGRSSVSGNSSRVPDVTHDTVWATECGAQLSSLVTPASVTCSDPGATSKPLLLPRSTEPRDPILTCDTRLSVAAQRRPWPWFRLLSGWSASPIGQRGAPTRVGPICTGWLPQQGTFVWKWTTFQTSSVNLCQTTGLLIGDCDGRTFPPDRQRWRRFRWIWSSWWRSREPG